MLRRVLDSLTPTGRGGHPRNPAQGIANIFAIDLPDVAADTTKQAFITTIAAITYND